MRWLVVAALREEAFAKVTITGDGAIRAERGAAAALARSNAGALIGIGVAGGVADFLRRGDVVVAKTIVDEEGVARECDPALVTAAIDCGAVPVTIASTRVLVRDKTKVAAAAVDMESAAWQRAASAKNVPFVAIRVILDPAGEALPEFLIRCTRRDGSVSRVRVATYAVLHPWLIPHLVRLASGMRAASRQLAAFMDRLLARTGANAYDRP